jgi:hypothetical protein
MPLRRWSCNGGGLAEVNPVIRRLAATLPPVQQTGRSTTMRDGEVSPLLIPEKRAAEIIERIASVDKVKDMAEVSALIRSAG